ncbi:MAG: stage IV sporulation protein A [Clostridia bacterium]|nr:stage IV sporulation protein A [Clostridia bacterium]
MTQTANIYRDISSRTSGEIYIGVVGPVRSGKSTLVRRFMDQLVLPMITNDYDRQRTLDELPQSAGGKTVMTTEPKFVPDEAVTVCVDGVSEMKVKLIDCVGYLIPGVLGDTENGEMRLVNTPWRDEPMPFDRAAEAGTRKVIAEHSTVGLLVTTDGSIGEIPRENYVEAEERVAKELSELGKPFAVILNSKDPSSPEAEALAEQLEEKYSAPVALLNCTEIDREDMEEVLKLLIPEFPIRELTLSMPRWMGVLDGEHWLRESVLSAVREAVADTRKMGDVSNFRKKLSASLPERCGSASASLSAIDMGTGAAELSLDLPSELFYKVIGETTGLEIADESELLSTMRSLAAVKRDYDRFATAIDEVNEKGYGIVMPDLEDMTLDEPQIVKQSGSYGVKLRATAPSIHMIRADIETELSPVVGTEQQSEELVKFILEEFEEDPSAIWNTNLFGRSIYELVNEGLHAKLEHMPEDAREKIGETLGRVINEGAAGLVCIIL